MDITAEPIIVAGIALAAVFLIMLLISLVMKLQKFISQLRYINMEIRRAGVKEREHWRRRRRRLWLSLLPFYR